MVNDNIIDHDIINKKPKPVKWYYFVTLVLIYALGLLILLLLNGYLPRHFDFFGNNSLLPAKVLSFLYVIFVPRMIIKDLNLRLPHLSTLKLILIVLVIVLFGELLQRSFQFQFLKVSEAANDEFLRMAYLSFYFISAPIVSAIKGSFFAWFKINKLRRNGVVIPYLILIFIIVMLFYLEDSPLMKTFLW